MLRIEIIGRVGKDAEARNVNNMWVTDFSVAHSEKYKTATGETKEKAVWVRCQKWTKQDNLAQHIKKGMLVRCAGSPKVSAYQKDGMPVANLEMTVFEFDFLSAKPAESSENYRGSNSTDNYQWPSDANAALAAPADDDLPF